MLEIRLVGTVDAIRDGEPVAMPSRRARALLALLALSPGDAVSIDSLAAGIWDEDPPKHVRASLQTYVGRLRRLLGGDMIATRPTGYALLVPRNAVDLLALWDSVEAADASDPAGERDTLGTILRHWHAEPFGDAPSDSFARHERTVWVERRLQAFERWVDLSFEIEDYRSCLEELNRQADSYPLREPLWVRLLTALDCVGRTAEALDRYEAVRKRLAEELGADPSPDLRAVYARLLERSDEGVGDGLGGSRSVVPRQLPARVRGFVGRDEQLAAMDRVQARSSGNHEGAVLALHGLAGSGKTSLALHWAHLVKDQFPDGQVFLDLQGYGPGDPMDTERALGALLRGLGVPGERIPDDRDERSAMLRSETEGRHLLVVLDNARESEQVRPLLPGSDALALVTSRTQLRGLVVREAAYRVRVDPMSPEESIALLQHRSVGGVGAQELRELAELCGNLPVALAVAAERIGRGGLDTHPVGALIAELGDHKSRLDVLAGGDDPLTNVRAVFEWSYQSLDDESARVLRHLGLYTSRLITSGAVAALIGTDRPHAERSLDRLMDRHLLMQERDGRYTTHDLVRAFAVEVALTEPTAEREAATARLRSWFLHSAARAQATWLAFQEQRLPDLANRVVPEEFGSPREASRWFETHEEYLRDLIATCVDEADPTGHLLAPMVFSDMNRRRGSARAGLELFQLAESGASLLGDVEGQAACANAVAGSHYGRRDLDAAAEAVTRSRDLYRRAGSIAGELRADGNLAIVLTELGLFDEAVAAHERAVDGARRNPAHVLLGRFLFNASDFYLSVGRLDDALRTGEEAVETLQEVDKHGDQLAVAIANLGDVHAASGRLTEAVETMSRGVDGYRRLGRHGHAANALRKLGIVYRDLGCPADARDCWRTADELLVAMDVVDTGKVSRVELGDLIESLDDE